MPHTARHHVTIDPSIHSFGTPVALEVRIVQVHMDEAIRMDGHPHRVDPDRWRPLIMSFQQLYGLSPRVRPSRLAEIPESAYRRGGEPAAPRPSPIAAQPAS